MKRYSRVMLGAKSMYAEECYQGNFIGANFDIHQDLGNDLPDNWREFNKKFVPIWLEKFPEKSKVAAGLSCGALWTISKGLKEGDVVLCPNGEGGYYVGEIISEYYYVKDGILPHRRKVNWYPVIIERNAMSEALKSSTGSIGTQADITGHAEEIKTLIQGHRPPTLITTDDSIEDPSVFAMEKHLEEFLAMNWKHTELGKKYKIYEEDGELIGKQYQTDVGVIDILAISKDKKEFLVVELKRGRVSDVVVGQALRYMGYVKDMVAELNQEVKGVIIGLEDDLKIQRALSVTPNISFYRYQISFKLFKG
ncbi:MAG: endonuclease NucS domain-containing protein [Cyclobacteriaceae bacterium]